MTAVSFSHIKRLPRRVYLGSIEIVFYHAQHNTYTATVPTTNIKLYKNEFRVRITDRQCFSSGL